MWPQIPYAAQVGLGLLNLLLLKRSVRGAHPDAQPKSDLSEKAGGRVLSGQELQLMSYC